MAISRNILKKLTSEEIINMVFEYQNKLYNLLPNLNIEKNLIFLGKTKMKSQFLVTRRVNDNFFETKPYYREKVWCKRIVF